MEISAGRATSIDKLPGDQRQGSGEVVNEILHEINAPGGGGGIGDGTQIFQRQTDGLVASPNENFAPQTQSDMQEMQSQHMQQHQMQGPQSAAIEGEVYSQPPPSQPEGEIAEIIKYDSATRRQGIRSGKKGDLEEYQGYRRTLSNASSVGRESARFASAQKKSN